MKHDSGESEKRKRSAHPSSETETDRQNDAPGGSRGAGVDAAQEAADRASTPAGPGDVEAKLVETKDRWLRAEAELQNFRRRAQREVEDSRRAAEEAALLDMAALLDDLERALESALEGGANPAWAQGVALVLQKGRDGLARKGLSVVDPVGERFDPQFHDAILEVDPSEGQPPGTVIQVAHKGYRRGDRSLRAARVVVAREAAS